MLDTRIEPETFWSRARRLFRERVTDDQLHDDRLRLAARIMLGWEHEAEIAALVKRLRSWAPRLLDGDALIGFYVDGMLRPLLSSGRTGQGWELLPEISNALIAGGGDKHSTRVNQVARLLASQIEAAQPPHSEPPVRGDGSSSDQSSVDSSEGEIEAGDDWAQEFARKEEHQTRELVRSFLEQLWRADAAKGLWQTVHSIEGSLPLLLALDGAEALVTIAQAVDREGADWLPQ
ncbi:MAG: hypothetical protein HC802_12560 [Caldilineaceae bacterium]|nr:hypothetical protein [Caldilineaceae bacterium]